VGGGGSPGDGGRVGGYSSRGWVGVSLCFYESREMRGGREVYLGDQQAQWPLLGRS